MKERARLFSTLAVFLFFPGFLLPSRAQQANSPAPRPTPVPNLDAQKRQDSFQMVWQTVNQSFYDPAFNGLDWKQVYERYAPLVAKTANDAQLHLLLQQMVNELHQSHYLIIPREAIPESADSATDSDASEDTSAEGKGGSEVSVRRLHRIRRALGERLSSGIGIDLRVIDGNAVVTRVEPDSAAANAGLRPGFVIKTANGKPLVTAIAEIENHPIWHKLIHAEIPLYLIATYINGVRETFVDLGYLDGSNREHSVRLKRAQLKGEMSPAIGNLPMMYTEFESKWLPGSFGYIRFNAFVPSVMKRLCPAIRSMHEAPGMILDLRGNRGGLLGLVGGVAGLLESDVTLVGTMQGRSGSLTLSAYPQDSPYLGLLIILVDGSTESAGEIFASTMRENGRAMIVGQQTAGNVVPSGVIGLPSGALFQYGLANFLTPSHTVLEGKGVIPDIIVPLSRRSLLRGTDPELATALKQLRLMAAGRNTAGELIADVQSVEVKEAPQRGSAPGPVEVVGAPKTEPPPVKVAATPALPGHSAAEALPGVDDILQKYVSAIGGRQAFERLTSRVSKAKVEMAALAAKGVAELYEKAPDKSVMIIDVPSLGVIQRGFDGKKAWLEDPLQGYIKFSGFALGSARLDSDFHKQLKLKEIYPGLFVQGREKVGDREAYVVRVMIGSLLIEQFYFDTQTGLLVRKGNTYYEDYREVDGVKLPFKIREEALSGLGITFTLTEVKHNVEIDDAKFAPYPSCFRQPGK